MSRTNRKYWSDGNWREARKGGPRYRRQRDAVRDADGPGQFTQVGAWAPRGKRHGGMLMHPSNSGHYRDESSGNRLKRCVKRRQRQAVMAEALLELAHDPTEALLELDDGLEPYNSFYRDPYDHRGEEERIVDEYYYSLTWDELWYDEGFFRAFDDVLYDEDDW